MQNPRTRTWICWGGRGECPPTVSPTQKSKRRIFQSGYFNTNIPEFVGHIVIILNNFFKLWVKIIWVENPEIQPWYEQIPKQSVSRICVVICRIYVSEMHDKYRQVDYSSCKSNLYLAPGILKVQRLFLEQTEALE